MTGVQTCALPISISLKKGIEKAVAAVTESLLADANRSILVAGLEPQKFTRLPGRDGIIYVAEMSSDGSRFKRMFIET